MEITITDINDPNVKKYELWSRGKINTPLRYYDYVLIEIEAENVKKKYREAGFGKIITLENAIQRFDGIKLFVASMDDKVFKRIF